MANNIGRIPPLGDDSEEIGLPDIEDDYLSPGKIQHVKLEESSLDEPLPSIDKVYNPREEEWDYEHADFHGSYEDQYYSADAALPADGGFDYGDGYGLEESHDESLEDEGLSARDEVDIAESILLGLEDGLGGEAVEDFGDYEAVDADEAFDGVEHEDDDEEDALAAVLSSIEGNSSYGGDDSEDDGDEGLHSNFRLSDEDEEMLQGFDIDEIISYGIDQKASDVHIHPAKKIGYRINGSMVKSDRFEPIPGEVTRRIQQKIVTNVADDIFLENWELDTSYTVRTGKHRGRRVRVNIVKSFEEIVMIMRIISQDIPRPSELSIEDELLEWTTLNRGLVMMNGPTGTGKSTTLASLIQEMQLTRADNIITVEKPVEYVYKDQGPAMILQREVGRDTLSFSAALDSAMREDPDIILIGEVRNPVEVNALLYAANTGHLSLSTTHANGAAETLNRIKGMYTGDEQRRVLNDLSSIAKGFASQVLCKTPDGNGRFAVREILQVNGEISDLIAQGDNKGIRRYQEDKKSTLDHKLLEAVLAGRCSLEEARSRSPEVRYFNELYASRDKLL